MTAKLAYPMNKKCKKLSLYCRPCHILHCHMKLLFTYSNFPHLNNLSDCYPNIVTRAPRLSENPAISTKLREWKECNLESNRILCNLQPPKMRETNNVNVNRRKACRKIVNVYFEQRFNSLVCLAGKLTTISNQNLTHHSPRATT